MSEQIVFRLRRVLLDLLETADDPINDTEETVQRVWGEVLTELEERRSRRPTLTLVKG